MEGKGKFFRLAGVGGHISGMVESVKGADKVVVIDGCPVACSKKCMEAAGISDYEYIVVTQPGIEKKHEYSFTDEENKKVKICLKEDKMPHFPAGRSYSDDANTPYGLDL